MGIEYNALLNLLLTFHNILNDDDFLNEAEAKEGYGYKEKLKQEIKDTISKIEQISYTSIDKYEELRKREVAKAMKNLK